MGEYLLDHHRVFNTGYDLDGTTAFTARFNIDIEYPLHTLRSSRAGDVRRRQLNLAVLGDLGVRAIPWCKQIRAVFVCGFAQHNGLFLKLA